MNNCGIDLSSKSSAICIMGDGLKIIWEKECSTDAAGFGQALQGKGKLCCIIEASPLCEWVADILEDLGHEVIVIDARNLARMGQTGWYTEVHRKSKKARLLRSHLKAKTGVVDAQRQQSNRIRGLLRAHGLKVGQSTQRAIQGSCDGVGIEYLPGIDDRYSPSAGYLGNDAAEAC